MITLINFSHPLSEAARAALEEQIAGGDLRVADIRVQVDLAAPLAPQVEAILAEAVAAAGGNPLNIDCIIPPGHAAVAAMVARALPRANLVVMRPVGTPPQYLPAQLVRAAGGFTIGDVEAAFDRLLSHVARQAVDTACIWAIHAAQEDVLAILAGEWHTDEPAAPSAPAGDIAPF